MKRTIKELKDLRDEMRSLKRRISVIADYVDENPEKGPKLRKCTHTCPDEPIVYEARCDLRHGQGRSFIIFF